MNESLPYAGRQPSASTGAHGDLLRVIRELNRMIVAAQVPATLGAQVFVEDPQTRRELLKILDLLNTMTGAPLVGNKVTGGIRQVRGAPTGQRGAVARNAARDAGTEMLMQTIPALRALFLDS